MELFAQELKKKFTQDVNPNFNEEHKKKIDENLFDNKWKTNFTTIQKSYREFSLDELNVAIKYMNGKTSLDGIGLSNTMLKKLGIGAKNEVLKIFNKCLKEEKVPDEWKHSRITMIIKSGQDSSLLSSYRPISMTPRLFERLVLHRLEIFLKINNIIIFNQSGFRKNRQTKDNLLYVIQNAREGFNKDEKTLSIFFDVAAAFDKVWHNGLIQKLINLGVHTISWR